MLCSSFAVRGLLLTLLLTLIAGCFSSSENLAAGGDDDADPNGGIPPANIACMAASDCVLAAATCCECPTFAVNVTDPAVQACAGIGCPDEGGVCADNVEAACNPDGFCQLVCAPTECATDCAAGYARDPSGCLTCACAIPEPNGCVVDTDCVETRADCCGCDAGGFNTAVLAEEASRFDAMLGCPTSPACPGVDACRPEDAPRCLQGQCALFDQALPANACGRPDLPACAAGTVCTVNANDPANLYGVGICAPS